MSEQKDIEIPGDAFYSNHFTIHPTGMDVFIDFQKLSVRFSEQSQKIYKIEQHTAIILNIVKFKNLVRAGEAIIKELEEKFGEITPPEFVKKLNEEQEKIIAKFEKQNDKEKTIKPEYSG